MLLTGQFIFASFADIASCLGPLTDTQWVGCTSLPGYKTFKVAQFSNEFNCYDTHVLNFFSSAKHVKYPKPIGDSGLDLTSMFLKWPPTGRCTVQQSLDHSFFGDIRDFDGVLRACSHEQLGQLVKDSIQNGVLVSSFDIVPQTKPASSRGITRAYLDERHGQAETNSSDAPAAAPEHACEVQDVDESVCACRGNCLSFACKKAAWKVNRWKKLTKVQDKTQRQICKQPHMSEMRFCLGCKCEITDCDAGRDKAHCKSAGGASDMAEPWFLIAANIQMSTDSKSTVNIGACVCGSQPGWRSYSGI
jgi:hypothetical protein